MSTINFTANIVILATGGLSRLYQRSTNPYTATGDGIALAWNVGAKLVDMEFIQFHPSALMIPGQDAFLLSEALRGEGAYLLDKNHRAVYAGTASVGRTWHLAIPWQFPFITR
jgi:L-aspartate oxidase